VNEEACGGGEHCLSYEDIDVKFIELASHVTIKSFIVFI
jgi:hypothetical protein